MAERPEQSLLGRLRWAIRHVSPFWGEWVCTNCRTIVQERRLDDYNYCPWCGVPKTPLVDA